MGQETVKLASFRIIWVESSFLHPLTEDEFVEIETLFSLTKYLETTNHPPFSFPFDRNHWLSAQTRSIFRLGFRNVESGNMPKIRGGNMMRSFKINEWSTDKEMNKWTKFKSDLVYRVNSGRLDSGAETESPSLQQSDGGQWETTRLRRRPRIPTACAAAGPIRRLIGVFNFSFPTGNDKCWPHTYSPTSIKLCEKSSTIGNAKKKENLSLNYANHYP